MIMNKYKNNALVEEMDAIILLNEIMQTKDCLRDILVL